MVRVLVVDDSSFVRRTLTNFLEADKGIKVIGTAVNGEEAVAKVAELDPDVVTMDVEMPRMDGLAALERIMNTNPCPVIMVSSLTKEGANTTLRALELGALDFIPKLTSWTMPSEKSIESELSSKIKALARRKPIMRLVFNRKKGPAAPPMPPGAKTGRTERGAGPLKPAVLTAEDYRRSFEVVSIGVSTGGPPAVQRILSELPGNFPVPILIAQHMPAAFTGPFAARLNSQCAITVKESEPEERAKPGVVYICPGGKHLRLENRRGTLTVVVTEHPKEALYRPSANVLMETTGIAVGPKALGVTLTGMGNDGIDGTRVLKAKGGWTITQNEASCVVYGMPKAVVDAGLANEVVDIADIARTILSHFIKQ